MYGIGSVQSHRLGIGDGYAPGYILALIATGALLRKATTPPELKLAILVSTTLPSWFANIGTRPLAWYLGHLAFLYVMTKYDTITHIDHQLINAYTQSI